MNVTLSARKLLVVISGHPDPAALRARLRDWVTPDTEVQVVVSPELTRLEWLTNADGDANDEAQELADSAGAATPRQAGLAPQVGDANAVQALADVLRTFAADEVLVVLTGEADGATEDLLVKVGELGLPFETLEIPSKDD